MSKNRSKRKAPQPTGIGTQRKANSQAQYIEALRILQAWGCSGLKKWWDVENVVAAVQLAGGRI